MKLLRLKTLATAALLCCAGTAGAATIAVVPATATAGTGGGATSPATLQVVFTEDRDADGTAEAGETIGYQVRLMYDTAVLDVTVGAQAGSTCSNDDAGGSILILNNVTAGTDALPSGNQCDLTFTVAAGQTAGASFPLDLQTVTVDDGCFDLNVAPTTCTLNDGEIEIAAGPTAPQLTFDPAAGGTVTLNAGGSGSIAVTAGAGTAGETATLTCSSDNGTAVVTGSPFAPNTTGSVAVQCTPVVGATAPVAISCTVDQSTGTDQGAVNFSATCPAITPSPEFSANLNVSLTGAPNATLTGGAQITNTGNANLTVGPCTVTGAFTVTPPAAIAPNASGTLGVSCIAPANAGTIATGTAVCTTNDPDDGEGTVTFTLSCGAQVLAVPAMGSFGKGILAALLAGLGLLAFAMRRRASV